MCRYSDSRDADGNPSFTRAIWKSVYAVGVVAAAIIDVVPQVLYTGDAWPVSRLDDGAVPFEVNTTVHLWSPRAAHGDVAISGAWGEQRTVSVPLVAGDNAVTITVPARAPMLWWPRGMGGAPNMYNLTVAFTATVDGGEHGRLVSTTSGIIWDCTTAAVWRGSSELGAWHSCTFLVLLFAATRRIGFRLIGLVTGPDTNATWRAEAAHTEGNADFTLMYRINGAAISARGANMIPMEILEGRYADGMVG